MKPEPRVFSKEAPCTKLELWQCFRSVAGFSRVPVVEAQAIIGANVPRVMERECRVVKVEERGVEYYELTAEGQEWLLKGFRSYLKNHPSALPKAKYVPRAWLRKARD